MPSTAHRLWRTTRARALDEVDAAHANVSGGGRVQRAATRQLTQAYALLLASHFQGYCRDLHTECADHLAATMNLSQQLWQIVYDEFLRGRQLDQGNAHPENLRRDFRRLGIELWTELAAYDPAATAWQTELQALNQWRNAIAHQDFTRVVSASHLSLSRVRAWRRTCRRAARTMDVVLRGYLLGVTGAAPW